MSLSRRQFVTHLSTAAAATSLIPRISSATGNTYNAIPRRVPEYEADASFADPERLKILAMAAVDAAKTAGASFADVRITRTIRQIGETGTNESIKPDGVEDFEGVAIGVRALVDGYWGFSASPYWELDEATRLATDAVAQARHNAKGSARRVELGKMSPVTGSWIMPVEIDPFTIPMEEKIDWLTCWVEDILRYRSTRLNIMLPYAGFSCYRQERVVANTEGSYFTQVVYQAGGGVNAIVGGRSGERHSTRRQSWRVRFPGHAYAGEGWERFSRSSWDAFLDEVTEAERMAGVPTVPFDVGRYDVVFDAKSAAAILDTTLGVATELDRMMGFEANASGTSFLGSDPMELLGAFQVASKLVTVSANRTDVGGLATVRWDDEGVEAHRFQLVGDGILTDLQTTRESADWIAPSYKARGQVVRSHGCAAAEAADSIAMSHRPNLVLEPATSDVSVDDLCKQIKKGFYVMDAQVRADFQGRTGLGRAAMREIVDGALGNFVGPEAAFSFDTLELWKNVIGVGGPRTQVSIAGLSSKGEPEQLTWHSVTGSPMAVTGVALIDPLRKV